MPWITARAPTCSNNVRKLTALRKYATIMLKRGYITGRRRCGTGTRNIANGQPDRRNGTHRADERGAQADVMRWHFENAWINKIEGPALKGAGNEVAIESMELCHEGLTLELEPATA